MSNPTLEGMARAGWAGNDPVLKNHLQCFPMTEAVEIEKMRAALEWLASNVSDEMMDAFADEWASAGGSGRTAISAALRAAAGENK